MLSPRFLLSAEADSLVKRGTSNDLAHKSNPMNNVLSQNINVVVF
jgi:hypothetical protein